MQQSNIRILRRNYQQSVFAASLLLVAALLIASAVLLSIRQDALLADTRGESQQLQLSLEDTIDVVRAHLFEMRRTTEYNLARPASPGTQGAVGPSTTVTGSELAKTARTEFGSLLVDPKASFDAARVQRGMRAATAFLFGAVANHQWNQLFQWTYFYDKAARWMLIYPALPAEEVLRVTKTNELGDAIRVLIDAGGTQPVRMVEPESNPKREMLWTPPYLDAAGKGAMVTLLSPIYLDNEYVGAIGTDVTLKTFDRTLRAHAPARGRSLIVDSSGNIVADTGNAAASDGRVSLAQTFPELTAGLGSIAPGDPAWLRYPLKGTQWTLLVHLPQDELRTQALKEQTPYLAMALLMFVALLGMGLMVSRRYSWPALQLAEHVERSGENPGVDMPPVPPAWEPIFEQVTATAVERASLLARTQAQADELETRVAERTAELAAANASLGDTVASLQKTRDDLVRADRMGSLGGMIAGVANELQGPLGQAAQTARRFHDGIDAFRRQQVRGLRKAELDAFVVEAQTVGHQVEREIGEAVELLGRFKQLALDQSGNAPRAFRLREVVDNVLAAMRPAFALHGSTVDNRIGAEIEMSGPAGTLGQILHHLLADAIERAAAVGASGCIELLAGVEADAQGELVVLTLCDNGVPASEEQRGQGIAAVLAQGYAGGSLAAHLVNGGSRVILRLRRSVEDATP
jgi:hypothetical protein